MVSPSAVFHSRTTTTPGKGSGDPVFISCNRHTQGFDLMLMDTRHLATIPRRLLPVLFYLMSKADEQKPDVDGYVTVSFPLNEMVLSLGKKRRAIMNRLRCSMISGAPQPETLCAQAFPYPWQ
jgi:hypothetical protein